MRFQKQNIRQAPNIDQIIIGGIVTIIMRIISIIRILSIIPVISIFVSLVSLVIIYMQLIHALHADLCPYAPAISVGAPRC